MLAEWLERFFSRCPRHLREMGCLREMLGIRRRYRRHRRAWAPHCQRSRELIQAAIARCPRRRKVVVFGSGWLHDVPLAELASAFDWVVLVDLFHPLWARWQARRFPNVRLLDDDVTGVLEDVWHAAQAPGTPLPHSKPTLFLDDGEVDLTISLNLLSQLPCMPEEFLRQVRSHADDQIVAFCRQVVTAHLDYLPRLPGVVTLLADVEVISLQPSGKEASRSSTLYGLDLPWTGPSWSWILLPRRRLWPHHAAILRVVGIEDVKTAPR